MCWLDHNYIPHGYRFWCFLLLLGTSMIVSDVDRGYYSIRILTTWIPKKRAALSQKTDMQNVDLQALPLKIFELENESL